MKSSILYVKEIQDCKEGSHLSIPLNDCIYEVREHYTTGTVKETKVVNLKTLHLLFIKHGTRVLQFARKQKTK